MKKILCVLLVLICVLSFTACEYVGTVASTEAETEALDGEYVLLSDTGCKHALLVDADGKIIAANSTDERMYPASMTKVMTFVVAYENATSLEDRVTITKEIKNKYPEASRIGIDAGDIMTVEQLLYALLLESDTDSALALAEYISGTEERFAVLMNEKAEALSLKDTHFANVTGLHDEDHYTTAREMAKIFDYALEIELFREIITTDTFVTYLEYYKGTELKDYRMTFYNTTISNIKGRFSKSSVPLRFGDGAIIGGKTGFTDEAGYCLALLVKGRSGEEYILITAGAPTKEKSAEASFKICSDYAE